MDARQHLDPEPLALDELYHQNSKHLPVRVACASAAQVAERERGLRVAFAASRGRYKTYAACPPIPLPRELVPLAVSLDDALGSRCSDRVFDGTALSVPELATLLARGYGLGPADDPHRGRPVPSGGGLYPLDLYVVQLQEGAIPAGVFHYHVGLHALQPIAEGCVRREAADASLYPEIVATASTLLVVAADMLRTRGKYGERAYRLALFETGHVAQNLYLAAAALGVGIVALDGFYDDRLHRLLELDGIVEIGLLVVALGHRA